MYKVKEIKLADQGLRQLEWAEMHMQTLMKIRERLSKEKPLAGIKISAVLHVTKETGVLVRTLHHAGAEVYLAGSNPLSTQDDVAAALASEGINVFAWKGENEKEYYENIETVAKASPNIIMDDGGDLHALVHEKYYSNSIIGGTEETTTGVVRLKAMEEAGVLKYPVIAVNNAFTKYLFDNRFGTGQSAIDGILRATNIMIAGKIVVISGYGWVGRGIASRMRGMGARVIVTEVSPVRALEALMDGFEVMPIDSAAEIGDIFVTATGNINVINMNNIIKMKDGAILANAGHFNVEIDVEGLKKESKQMRNIRPFTDEYLLPNGKRVYLLAEGRLVNLAAAEGHPSEVMDMSFANQALSVEYMIRNKDLKKAVYNVPEEIDNEVASLKLSVIGVKIDEMTKQQKEYSKQWKYGT
ncbi:adenosylhomocysteinase [Sulfuracidifex metallicus]|uniref:adenosylhomocysteinase n=1 Tax=Sulfuracidifex metallicus TaxID=47303 RepID=UPI0022768EEE|nr:adenosylhomocysteinase [Sulfuracidifex metallicus]MCY0850823.1 adenosylhomocysteinase [Sulfuracidifex metallicus]